jgi:KAP family P-loop domain
VDTNLWASLVENIFSCLDEYLRSQEGGAKLADSLFSKLATPQRLRLESAERVSNASKALEIAQRRLEQEREKAEVEQRRRSLDAGKLLRLGTRAFEEALSPEQKGALKEAVHELGLQDDIDTTQQLVKQAQRARTLVGRLALVCRSIASRGLSRTQIAVCVFLFACLTLIGWLIGGHVAQWLSGGAEGFAHRVGVVLGALLGAATTFVALAGKALKAVTALGRFAKKIQSEMSGLNAADEAARQELVALAERTVATAVQELQVAKVDFESTSPQRLLTEFIRDKARGDSYSKHLGLVATIRKDFDRLSQIMCGTEEQWPEQDADQQKTILQYRDILEREGLSLEDGEASEDLKMLDRIILYIDDLDRCGPDKVAEVLQAVHLLLAFPLFVVVVAVDYRWVASALRAYYRGQLADEIDGVSGRTDKRAASDAARTIAQPDDYIEKIFQIPYWVRPIDEATGAAFLESLTGMMLSHLPSIRRLPWLMRH